MSSCYIIFLVYPISCCCCNFINFITIHTHTHIRSVLKSPGINKYILHWEFTRYAFNFFFFHYFMFVFWFSSEYRLLLVYKRHGKRTLYFFFIIIYFYIQIKIKQEIFISCVCFFISFWLLLPLRTLLLFNRWLLWMQLWRRCAMLCAVCV